MKTYSVKYNIISFFFSLDYSLLVAFCIYIYILIWDSRIGYSLQNWNCSTLGTAQNRGNFHCWFVFIFISFFWCAWLSSIRINATIGCHQINETIKLEHMQIETFDGWKKMSVFVANNFRINQTHRRRMQRIYIYIYAPKIGITITLMAVWLCAGQSVVNRMIIDCMCIFALPSYHLFRWNSVSFVSWTLRLWIVAGRIWVQFDVGISVS